MLIYHLAPKVPTDWDNNTYHYLCGECSGVGYTSLLVSTYKNGIRQLKPPDEWCTACLEILPVYVLSQE